MSKERPFENIVPVPNIKVGYFEKEEYLKIIDRQEKQINSFADTIRALQSRIDILEKSEKPQGKWIKQYGKSYELITNEGVLVGEFTKCPKCQYDKARGSNFCPNCGTDMRPRERR